MATLSGLPCVSPHHPIKETFMSSKHLSSVIRILITPTERRTIDVPAELLGAVQAALRQAGLDVHPYVRRSVPRLIVRYTDDPTAAFIPSFLRITGDSKR